MSDDQEQKQKTKKCAKTLENGDKCPNDALPNNIYCDQHRLKSGGGGGGKGFFRSGIRYRRAPD